MNIKVGMKVRLVKSFEVAKKLHEDGKFEYNPTKDMSWGQLVTIAEINEDGSFHIEEAGYGYHWEWAIEVIKRTKIDSNGNLT